MPTYYLFALHMPIHMGLYEYISHYLTLAALMCDMYIIGERERANLVLRLATNFLYIYMFAAGVTHTVF